MLNSTSTKIKGFLFDAGGTLLHPYASVGTIYSEVATRHGGRFEPGALDRAFEEVFGARRSPDLRHPGLSRVYKDWWREIVFQTLEVAGSQAQPDFHEKREIFFEELYDVFATPEVWRLYPETGPVLSALHGSGYKLALVSNWDLRLRRLLGGLGLETCFDAIVISAEVGVEKPESEIFKVALDRLGLRADEVCHVGDSHFHDVIGAARAGIRSFHLNRPRDDLRTLLEPFLDGTSPA